jgi:hypothetical protein
MFRIPLFIEKCVLASWFSATPVPSDLPLNLTYILISLLQLLWGNWPYVDFLYSMYLISCPFSLAWVFIWRISPNWRTHVTFCNQINMSWWGMVSTISNSQIGRPPLVSCPWLLIQYIHSRLPYFDTISVLRPRTCTCHGDRGFSWEQSIQYSHSVWCNHETS